ncbi:hypothetical protein TWF481_009333 [Arthrobotrys musiformis]|uniref:Uncharacterized protein n=1 Tax=Arthrobotrys musiformis TaxID=47236 RepID=A0AAV9W3G0_9PEZI
MSYTTNDGKVPESYRIRKIRWFGPSTLAIWFHDVAVAEYFVQKGVWLMEGFVGVGKNKKVGTCGLPTVYPLLEQSRSRMVPHHHAKARHTLVQPPTAQKEGHGGQHGRNNGGAKGGSKLGWHQKH